MIERRRIMMADERGVGMAGRPAGVRWVCAGRTAASTRRKPSELLRHLLWSI